MTLRRSFAVYSTTRPGAELGLGIQLGHAAWRMTSGYAADGKQSAVRHLDERRRALFRSQATELITGSSPVAGPSAKVVEEFRAQIITDPARAERLSQQLADRLHYGLTNDCMWDPSTSSCSADRPLLADHVCSGSECSNAIYGPAHEQVLRDAIDRLDLALDRLPDSGPGALLRERLGRDRANLVQVVRQLTQATPTGQVAS